MRSTKDLAWELGCLRKRSSTAQQRRERSTKARQLFSHLVVIDFESTCWEDSKYRTQEIIEFPAVLLNTSTGKIESEFHYYVQPTENPMLSEFCKQLTGIKQDQVDEGIPLSIVLSKFNHWLRHAREQHRFVYNEASEDGTPRCTFVTWSDWDFGVCLQYETRRKQLRKPPELNAWVDLRATYRKFYERKPKGLNGALQDLGLDFEGREHSGLHDARNTARLAYRMICDGCIMNITKSIQGSEDKKRPTVGISAQEHECIAWSNLRLNNPGTSKTGIKTTASTSSNKQADAEISTSVPTHSDGGPKIGKRMHIPDCVVPVANNRFDEQVCALDGSKSGVIVKKGHNFSGHPSVIQFASDNKVSDSPAKKKSRMIQPCSKSFSIYRDPDVTSKTNPTKSSYSSVKRGLKEVTNVHSSFSGQPIKSVKSDPKFGASSMAVVTKPHFSSDKSTLSEKAMFRTPVLPLVKPSVSSMKATPPMCSCGRRAKRKFVQAPGPNQGRAFFCCGVVKSSKKGCTFFKWEPPGGSQNMGTSPILPNNVKSVCDTENKLSPGLQVQKFGFRIPQPDFNTPQLGRIVQQNQSISSGKKTLGYKTPRFVMPPPLLRN